MNGIVESVEVPSSVLQGKVVFLMLHGKSMSPCFMFGANENTANKNMTSKMFRDIIIKLTNLKEGMPEIFFLTNPDEEIEGAIVDFISGLDDRVIYSYHQGAEKESISGIQQDCQQIKIFQSIIDLKDCIGNLEGSPVILQVKKEELDLLPSFISDLKEQISRISIRPYQVDSYSKDQLKLFHNCLIQTQLDSCRNYAGGGTFAINNFLVDGNTHNYCPAIQTSLTIGPDGMFYPCPAFFHSGRKNSLGSALEIDMGTLWMLDKSECRQCGESFCGKCIYSEVILKDHSMCQYYQAENEQRTEIFKEISRSGYLFSGYQTMHTRRFRDLSNAEGGEGLQARQQTHDITLKEFQRFIMDLSNIIDFYRSGQDESSHEKINQIIQYWKTDLAISRNLRRSVFRRRVLEIFNELKNIQDLKSHLNEEEVVSERPDVCHVLTSEEMYEVKEIFNYLLGWEQLSEWYKVDKNVGFANEPYSSFLKERLFNAKQKLNEWFQSKAKENNWPSIDGYSWLVNFETGCIQLDPIITIEEACKREGGFEGKTRTIMTLGAADKEVIMRLHEKRAFLGDYFYLILKKFQNKEVSEEEFSLAVKELGEARHHVQRWFDGMSKEYQWPKSQNGWSLDRDYDDVLLIGS